MNKKTTTQDFSHMIAFSPLEDCHLASSKIPKSNPQRSACVMVVCLLLDLGLKAAFEFKGEVVAVDRDPLDQPPDQPFIGV